MRLIKNFFRSGGARNVSKTSAAGQDIAGNNQTGINQRLKEIYGSEKIELQLLYERWVARESWLLQREALPLLYGLDPESTTKLADPELKKNMDELWIHACACVEQGLLKVNNHETDAGYWRCNPVDVYRWAVISRINTPEIFNTLMAFVTRVIKIGRAHV